MATMGACRLLLVCVFCTLWGGAVTSADEAILTERLRKVSETTKKSKEALEGVENNLRKAEKCVEKPKVFEDAKDDVTCLAAAVKDAMEAAGAAMAEFQLPAENSTTAQPPPAEESLEIKELGASLNTAIGAVFAVFSEVKRFNETAGELSVMVEKKEDGKKDAFETKVKNVKGSLAEVVVFVSMTIEAHEQVAEKAKEIVKKMEEKFEDGGVLYGSEMRLQDDNEGKEGQQFEIDGKEPVMQSSQGAGDDKLSTDGPTENNSTSSSTHEGDTPDGAHGGAITTCTAAPLLLLLTAVAYAAVC